MRAASTNASCCCSARSEELVSRNARSAPVKAARNDPGSSKSPSTRVANGSSANGSHEPGRIIARNGTCRAESAAATRRPIMPVAPATTMSSGMTLSSSAHPDRAGVFVITGKGKDHDRHRKSLRLLSSAGHDGGVARCGAEHAAVFATEL